MKAIGGIRRRIAVLEGPTVGHCLECELAALNRRVAGLLPVDAACDHWPRPHLAALLAAIPAKEQQHVSH